MYFGPAGAFERDSFSGPGSEKASPMVEAWIGVCCARRRSPQCLRNHCVAPSPTDTLIVLKVRCRLCRQIPVGPNVDPLILLRVAVTPQRRPARRGNVWWLRFHPDVIQSPPDLSAIG